MKAVKNRNATTTRICAVVASLLVSLAVVCGYSVPAMAGFATFDQAMQTKSSTMKKVYAHWKASGYSDAAIAGVMGNMNEESGFDIRVKNQLGCVGLVQFCFARSSKLQSSVPDWSTNEDAHIKYILNDMNTYSTLKNISTGQTASYLSAAGIPVSQCSPKNLDDLKKTNNPGCAAMVLAAVYEVCGTATAAERAGFAQQVFKNIGKLGGASVSGDNKSNDSKSNDDKSDSKSGSKSDVTEDSLTGMPERENYSNSSDSQSLQLPDKQLTGKEGYSLAQLQNTQELMSQYQTNQTIRILIMVIGFIIFGYSILIAMAMMFDKSNTVFEFSLLSVVTFGRLNLVNNRFDEGKTRVTTKKAIQLIAIGFLISAFVLSGAYFGWAVEAWFKITDFLGDFSEWMGGGSN